MGPTRIAMSLLPYTSPYARYGYGYGYGAPYGAYGGYGPGFYGAGYPYGPYGMTAEEIQKVREAEEKAFNDAETKRKEFMEAEKKKYEEFVAAEKKRYEDYVSAQKKAVEDAITKEKELAEKLGPPMAHMAQQALSVDTATVMATLAITTHMAMEHMGAHTTRRMLICNALCRT